MSRTQRADFSAAPLVHTSSPDAVAELAADALLGLPFQFHTVYGTLRDGAGEMYALTRRITRGDGGPMRLILQTTRGGLPHLKLHEAGRAAARARDARRSVTHEHLAFVSAASSTDRSFVLRRELGALEWNEEGTVAIRGVAIGPELKWYLPRSTQRFLYISQFFFVEGTILGDTVRGFVCFDDTYKPDEDPAAGRRHPWNPLIDDGLGIAIFNWGNHYTDGSSEVGLFALGHECFGVGLYANTAGQVIATRDIDGEVTLAADGRMPSRIDVRLSGEQWEFLPDVRGSMPNLASSAQEIDGRMHRVGDARVPDVWFSWGQTFPAQGTRRNPTAATRAACAP